jgi:hypothetical protein
MGCVLDKEKEDPVAGGDPSRKGGAVHEMPPKNSSRHPSPSGSLADGGGVLNPLVPVSVHSCSEVLSRETTARESAASSPNPAHRPNTSANEPMQTMDRPQLALTVRIPDDDAQQAGMNRGESAPERTELRRKSIECHVNSLDRYKAIANPSASEQQQQKQQASPKMQPNPTSRRQQRQLKKLTPFDAPQNFVLLAECPADVQRIEMDAQKAAHVRLASEDWSFTIVRDTQ